MSDASNEIELNERDANLERLRYPIGQFIFGKLYTTEETRASIERITLLPGAIGEVTISLTPQQWGNTYRQGAWTALQLYNHLVDVFINAYMRTKWVLTEDKSILKPYNENKCAELADANYQNTAVTSELLRAVINRWVYLLVNLDELDFGRSIFHPEYDAEISLRELIAMYEWHGYHHLEHLYIIRRCK